MIEEEEYIELGLLIILFITIPFLLLGGYQETTLIVSVSFIILVSTTIYISLTQYSMLPGREDFKNRWDYFPWNEANIVFKNQESTVVDCAFKTDASSKNEIIYTPVIFPYSNLS